MFLLPSVSFGRIGVLLKSFDELRYSIIGQLLLPVLLLPARMLQVMGKIRKENQSVQL
jgi:hypothetical protein